MDEATQELVERVSEMSPQEIIDKELDKKVGKWISTSFRKEVESLVRIPHHNRTPDWCERIAQAQHDLMSILYAYQANVDLSSAEDISTLEQWNHNLTSRLFGDPPGNPNSVVGSGKTTKQQEEITTMLIGSINGAKMINYLLTVRPELREKISLRRIFNKTLDAKHKVDYLFELGDENSYTGEKIIRLVQLKTVKSSGSPQVCWLDPEREASREALNHVSEEDIKTMLDFSRGMMKESGCDVRSYVITVPSYSPPNQDDLKSPEAMDNVFGLDTSRNRKRNIAEFKYAATKSGFLP